MKRRCDVPFRAEVSTDGRTHFSFWAPEANSAEVVLESGETFPLAKDENGLWTADGPAGLKKYRYRVNGEHLVPDPASHYQPEDVHGPSAVVRLEGCVPPGRTSNRS